MLQINTDEDAFDVLAHRGISIVVKGNSQSTSAMYALEDPQDVKTFIVIFFNRLHKC